MMKARKSKREWLIKCLAVMLVVLAVGFLIPEPSTVPVLDASSKDWHPQSFWYYPWGQSGVHKGVDVFAQRGTAVVASTPQLVVYRGELSRGGKVVLALGPKWRFHYYAHLDETDRAAGRFVKTGERLGTVGNSGNALGKAPHLHYSVVSMVPLLWRMDRDRQGYLKAFYVDPLDYF